jgi:hypothetical protein
MKKAILICLGYLLNMIPAMAQTIPYRIDDQAPARLWMDEEKKLCLCDAGNKSNTILATRKLQPGDVIILDVMKANKNEPDDIGSVFSEPEEHTIKIPIRWVKTDTNAVRLRNYELSFLYQIILTNRTQLPEAPYSVIQENSIWNYVMKNLIAYKNRYGRVLVKIDIDTIKLNKSAGYVKQLFKAAVSECWTELIIPTSTEKNIAESMNKDNKDGLGCTNDTYYAKAFTEGNGREFGFNAYSVLLHGCQLSYSPRGSESTWSLFDWLYSGILRPTSDSTPAIPDSTHGVKISVKLEHPFLFWRSRRYKFLPGKGDNNKPITLSQGFINKIVKEKKKRKVCYLREETLKEMNITQINKIKFFEK